MALSVRGPTSYVFQKIGVSITFLLLIFPVRLCSPAAREMYKVINTKRHSDDCSSRGKKSVPFAAKYSKSASGRSGW